MEIGRLWADKQTITGPVLNVPGSKVISADGKTTTTTLHILPESLDITATTYPEIRYRGIYETVVYDSEIDMSGTFNLTGFTNLDGYTYDWDNAYFSLGVSDNRGLKDKVVLLFGKTSIEAEPGAGQSDIFTRGISFPSAIGLSGTEPFDGKFILKFGLKGSEGIFFSPVGKTTNVKLSSTWNSPSFQGNFLPNQRTVTTEGFTAEWVVTHLNRNFPQAWTGQGYAPENDSFGADMVLEIDHYKKTERSAKYGILFIVLTFFVLIIIEVKSSERIHIFYYLLVAFALIMFFSLLSALSEHIGFNPAYIISSVATIALLSAFFGSLLRKRWAILMVSGMITVLYIFIFVLLALKDYAYLAGNIGLFILLAVLMMLTSRLRLFSEKTKDV
jgi:inner membrane protein